MPFFSESQIETAALALSSKVFLSGPAGAGKTTTALAYLEQLRDAGISGNQILILLPQRSLGLAFQNHLDQLGDFNGGVVTVQTLGGVAQRMIRLFWPVIAGLTLYPNPKQPPIFLTLETAQYYLYKISQPFFDAGHFADVHVEKPRILSQILDNLNKAAVVGFPHQEIAERLKSAWDQMPAHVQAYDQAQAVAVRFRQFCYENNFLDFSLQIEIFVRHIWPSLICREYLTRQYPYIIYENCEEDIPVFHDILLEWLPELTGGLILFDEQAGFRYFLGADPGSAQRLRRACEYDIRIPEAVSQPESIRRLQSLFSGALQKSTRYEHSQDISPYLTVAFNSYYPEMIDKIAVQVADLAARGVSPGQIAILAPFVSDALRFQLQNALEKRGIPITAHRPSRSLREEPLTHVMLTWARLAHPEWGMPPSHYDLRLALIHSIAEMDPIRADLLARLVYQPKKEAWLSDTASIRMEMQERITLSLCNKYQKIYAWLMNHLNDPSDLDFFMARMFGEILSQPGFGFFENFNAANVTARLIESVRKFRRVVSFETGFDPRRLSKEFVATIEKGIIAALYLESWEPGDENAVYLSPAYTFLMQNRQVSYQFWVDIGSMGWWQRLLQPLTQPYVLSRNWEPGRKWTDVQEYDMNQANLERLVHGLLNRCTEGIYVHSTGYNESGNDEKGPLLNAVQRILRNAAKPMEIRDV